MKTKAANKEVATGEEPKCSQCHKDNEWRLMLRMCSHVVCVHCGGQTVEDTLHNDHEPGQFHGIHCPQCQTQIHPNDIYALLSTKDVKGIRLLHRYEQLSVEQALYADGIEYKHCPGANCRDVYTIRDGCNYVRCADRRCRTRFCWQCGEQTSTWRHFLHNGDCRLGWDDAWQLLWPMRALVNTGGCCLCLLSPIAWFTLFIALPIYLLIGTPYNYANKVYLRKERLGVFTWPLICLAVPPCLLLGAVLAVLSIFFMMWVYFLFTLWIYFRQIPQVGRVIDAIYILQLGMSLAGLDDWRDMIRDAQQQRREHEEEQFANRQREKEATDV